ncbi:probable LRR receptor-like serine/threonine-protein kinase At3g47570 [Pyrus x bretschneideri]|uniref:probable LRR receptor-like serine/threonine-protein kinase At3g47570 n=1 Tax=Pyrus x bretschneideri TaxID=225117 RepID=UPI00202F332F|nr:probable LRR receptor-like serine/threonine-protein kinase At3g47570 [Pyrus x bretschneideri]
MSNLFRLEIDTNNLGNNEKGDLDFLSSLVNCTNLKRLDIRSNHFGGVLPESVSNLSIKLEDMRMGWNQIRGSIPSEIGNFINLRRIDFEENLLRGSIPSSISKLDKLIYLVLDNNQLSGTIPPSIGNLSFLETIDLMSNSLERQIPQSLGNCSHLIYLNLSQNILSGPIPLQVLSSLTHVAGLDLSRNQLTGSIPFKVGNMQSLEILDLSANMLSGEVPESLVGCKGLSSLYLRGNSFQGTIPQSLGSLRLIENLDLSCNNLSGGIPTNLGSFRLLQNLNLSHNDLEGSVPTEGVFTNRTAFYIEGNKRLCGGIPTLQLPICNSSNSNNKQDIFPWRKVLISIACGSGIGVILLLCFILLYPARKALRFVLLYLSSKARSKLTLGSSWEVSLLKVSCEDLLKATNGFSSRNLIGAGGFGSVYRGILNQEERIVAVKVLNAHRSRESFMVECETLKNIRHRNLVKLLTVCVSIDFQGNDFLALVYEFMTNGNLEEWLHFSAHRLPGAPIVQGHLNLTQRVNIAIDIATALNYLHNHSHMPIVHCDLKPSNVLLEGNMTARIADFGLARYVPDASCSLPSHRSTANVINGSIGYIAPECGIGNEVSTYGDVYSYGILLLEMLTGKRPTDEMFKDDLNLHNFVRIALPELVEEICDPVLLQIKESSTHSIASNSRNQVQDDQRQRVRKCLVIMASIGVACSADLPRERMDIGHVVDGLCLARDVLSGTSIRST